MGLLDEGAERAQNVGDQNKLTSPDNNHEKEHNGPDAKQVEKKDARSFQEKLSAWEKDHQVSIDAHPGESASRKDAEAFRVLAAAREGLKKLGDCKGDCGKIVQLGDEQFAKVTDRDKIDTSKWESARSVHSKTAKESGNIPDHPGFRVKMYDMEKAHDNPIAVTSRTLSFQHAFDTIRYLLGDTHVNARYAERFLRQTHPELE